MVQKKVVEKGQQSLCSLCAPTGVLIGEGGCIHMQEHICHKKQKL
jgi:hypothetical protein